MASSRSEERRKDKERTLRELWTQKRSSFVPGRWVHVQPDIYAILCQLQQRPGRLEPRLEIIPPDTLDDLRWNVIAHELVTARIPNVIFVDTEYARSPFPCNHAEGVTGDCPPCYSTPALRDFRLRTAFVDWRHAERFRLSHVSFLNPAPTCPAIARVFSICNSDGRSVLVDLLRLGGVPTAMRQLLSDRDVHKIVFNLSADLPVIQASVSGFTFVPESFFDASFEWRLSSTGKLVRRKDWGNGAEASWAATGPEPKLSAVFHDWVHGMDRPTGRNWEPHYIGSLSGLCATFTGCVLPKSRDLQGRGLEWFMDERRSDLFTSAGRKFRHYALADAVAAVAVYVGSLLIRPEWRRDRIASSRVIEWVQRHQVPAPTVPVPTPTPRMGLVKSIFRQERSAFNRYYRPLERKRNLLDRTNWFHRRIDVWVSRTEGVGRRQNFTTVEMDQLMFRVKRHADQEHRYLENPKEQRHKQVDRKMTQQIKKYGEVRFGRWHQKCVEKLPDGTFRRRQRHP